MTGAEATTNSGTVDVTVVVVAYNRADLLSACLQSIAGGSVDREVEVVVVDNSPGDEVGDLVRAEHPEVRYLGRGENLGFARACNLGAEMGTGRLLLLLNPDTTMHAGTIDALADHLEAHPSVGILGGRTFDPEGNLDPGSAWGSISLWSLFCYATGLSWLFSNHPVLDPESLGRWRRDSVREVGTVTGCLLMAEHRTWDRLGGFDEDFFMYAEDADLCWRARGLGFRPSIIPEATITHDVGSTSESTAARLVLRNRGICTLIAKRWAGGRRRLAICMFLLGTGLRALGYGAAALVSGTAAGRSQTWAEVWRRRREWRDGYPRTQGAAAGRPGAGA